MKEISPDDFQEGMMVTILRGPWEEIPMPTADGASFPKREVKEYQGEVFELVSWDLPFVRLRPLVARVTEPRNPMEMMMMMQNQGRGGRSPTLVFKITDVTLGSVSQKWIDSATQGCDCNPEKPVSSLLAKLGRKKG